MASDLVDVSLWYLESMEYDILVVATKAMKVGVLVFHRKFCEGRHFGVCFQTRGAGKRCEVCSDFGACCYNSLYPRAQIKVWPGLSHALYTNSQLSLTTASRQDSRHERHALRFLHVARPWTVDQQPPRQIGHQLCRTTRLGPTAYELLGCVFSREVPTSSSQTPQRRDSFESARSVKAYNS